MTSSVNNNFFGIYQNEIAHTVMVVPICFEVGRFLYKVKTQENSWDYLKDCAIHLFKQDYTESREEFRKRQLKTFFKTVITTAAVFAVVFGFPVFSYIYIASIAISVISFIAKAYVHRKEISEKLIYLKDKVIKFYSFKSAKTLDARKKILKNYLITIAALTVLGAFSSALFLLLHPIVAAPALLIGIIAVSYFIKSRNKIFKKQENETTMQRNLRIAFHLTLLSAVILSAILLPELSNQIKKCLEMINNGETWVSLESSFKFIYLEYITVGLIHLSCAFHQLSKGNKKLALFYFLNSLIGFFIPLSRIGEENPRLHHDFSGLVLSLAPFRALKFLGTGYTLDSLMYHIDSDRSYLNHSSYDFANIVLEYSLLSYIVLAAAVEKTLQNILSIVKKKKQEHEEDVVSPLLANFN
jgi:hypothetical protein